MNSQSKHKQAGFLRIIQITDPHLFATSGTTLLNVDTQKSFAGVMQYIQKHETSIDGLLVTGDISQDESHQSYATALDASLRVAPMVRGLPGNHDSAQQLTKYWSKYADAITDIGSWRIVMLNSVIPKSNAGYLEQSELDMLEQACLDAPSKHILVAVHHNPVPMGSMWLDAMMISNSHALFTLIQTLPNVQGVIWGHVHQEFDGYYTVRPKPETANKGISRKIRLLACPATSVQFMPHSTKFALDMSDPGYRWLNLFDNGEIETGVTRVSGLGLQPDTASKGY